MPPLDSPRRYHRPREERHNFARESRCSAEEYAIKIDRKRRLPGTSSHSYYDALKGLNILRYQYYDTVKAEKPCMHLNLFTTNPRPVELTNFSSSKASFDC